MRFKLSNKNKLKLKIQISEVFRNKKYLKNDNLKLLYKKVDENESTKVAFFIPKRNIKLAVNRKKIKRLLFENFRLTYPLITIKENYHLIFIWESKNQLNYKTLNESIKNLLTSLSEL